MDINEITSSLNILHNQMQQNPKQYEESSNFRETISKFFYLERKIKKRRRQKPTTGSVGVISPVTGIKRLRYNRAIQLRKAYEARFDEGTASPPKLSFSIQSSTTKDNFRCYICKIKTESDNSHSFYDQLCESCGNFNYEKRKQTSDLTGKVSIVTGGRIKIGFETALKLLRAGSTVIITTRFRSDALKRYSNESDYDSWKHRLEVLELDLRYLPKVNEFCTYIRTKYEKIDILIQNAAQTIWRPNIFYKSLLDADCKALKGNGNLSSLVSTLKHTNNPIAILHPEDLFYSKSLELAEQHFPSNMQDEHGQQLDLRPTNSWTQEIQDVSHIELIETNLINYISPFILLQNLLPILTSTENRLSYVILVSAMEGSFSRTFKSSQHVHTNSAKASLNMIVRTCSDYLFTKHQICMNAVDTGWVTDERPAQTEAEYISKPPTPLDEIDGASRILDPIFQSLNNAATKDSPFGLFLKDYRPTTW